MIESVIFDFDGVITDSVPIKTEVFRAMYEHHGPEVADRVVTHHLEHGGVSRMEKFRHYHREFLGRTLDEKGVDELSAEFSDRVMQRVIEAPLLPGAKQALDNLQQQFPLHVCSGTPESELVEIIRQRNLSRYFVSVHGSPVKKADLIRLVLSRYGYDPSRTVFIGDATTDRDAARATGLPFIAVLGDGPSALEGERHAIRDLTDLEIALEGLGL